jgi:integrase
VQDHPSQGEAREERTQDVTVPDVMRPVLRAWWEGHGCPVAGPVFPARRGDNAGGFKSARSTYASRLRRSLLKAGVTRHDVHNDVEGVSRRADFHSFGRAYVSALAGAGVNVQLAMQLASHSDIKTHALYSMRTEAMKQLPASAVPQIKGDTWFIKQQPAAIAKSADSKSPGITSARQRIRTSDLRLRSEARGIEQG